MPAVSSHRTLAPVRNLWDKAIRSAAEVQGFLNMATLTSSASPSARQQWLLKLLLTKRQTSSLLCLPRELLYQIISLLDASSFVSLALSSYVQFQYLLPDLVPAIPTYEWVVLRILSRLMNDPTRDLRIRFDHFSMSLPTELTLPCLEFMPRQAQVQFIVAHWTMMVYRGIVPDVTDELLMKELVIAGMVCKRLALR